MVLSFQLYDEDLKDMFPKMAGLRSLSRHTHLQIEPQGGRFQILNFLKTENARRNTSESHYRLGEYFVGLGEYDDAILELQRAVDIDPYFAVAHARLFGASMCKGKKHWSFAIQEVNRTLAKPHMNKSAEISMALAWFLAALDIDHAWARRLITAVSEFASPAFFKETLREYPFIGFMDGSDEAERWYFDSRRTEQGMGLLVLFAPHSSDDRYVQRIRETVELAAVKWRRQSTKARVKSVCESGLISGAHLILQDHWISLVHCTHSEYCDNWKSHYDETSSQAKGDMAIGLEVFGGSPDEDRRLVFHGNPLDSEQILEFFSAHLPSP
eukprot:TRINITY_DN20694_c0_g1_i1.p1 TRINITY_DN20694_c0_g1~~TRINITY_DN20694_c0_g1_i1.p1  ORF type:complete len:327 (+),score=40.96 TRINITY_DN20694_c0_g1_i1:934-1914(+)